MKKILVVEDEQLIADVVVKFLSNKGYEVDVAYDLPSAFEAYHPGLDVILLDIDLKGEESFSLLSKIKSETPNIVVLMFSGYDSEDYINKAKKLGADGFIPKPFRIEFLEDFLLPKIEHIRFKKQQDV